MVLAASRRDRLPEVTRRKFTTRATSQLSIGLDLSQKCGSPIFHKNTDPFSVFYPAVIITYITGILKVLADGCDNF